MARKFNHKKHQRIIEVITNQGPMTISRLSHASGMTWKDIDNTLISTETRLVVKFYEDDYGLIYIYEDSLKYLGGCLDC